MRVLGPSLLLALALGSCAPADRETHLYLQRFFGECGAEYGGTTPIKVWHVLTYREGALTTELWQVAPDIQIAP